MEPAPARSPARRRLRWILFGVAALFFGVLLVDALNLFSTQEVTGISHGNHVHYVPLERDEGVDLGQCPQQPPGPNELLTPQCQIVRVVVQGEQTFYVPLEVDTRIPLTQFPTRPPGSGEIITPQGELQRVE